MKTTRLESTQKTIIIVTSSNNIEDIGHVGDIYSIPINDSGIPIKITKIENFINRFISYAKKHKELSFQVTDMGDYRKYFYKASRLENVELPHNYIDRYVRLLDFVKISHIGQKRKWSGEEYWTHPYAVSLMAKKHIDCIEPALCHDLIEDTSVTYDNLYFYLINNGYSEHKAKHICDVTEELTDKYTSDDYPELSRKDRTNKEADRLSRISDDAQIIKMCDILHNCSSITFLCEKFAKIYLDEKILVVSKFKEHTLKNKTLTILNAYKSYLQ